MTARDNPLCLSRAGGGQAPRESCPQVPTGEGERAQTVLGGQLVRAGCQPHSELSPPGKEKGAGGRGAMGGAGGSQRGASVHPGDAGCCRDHSVCPQSRWKLWSTAMPPLCRWDPAVVTTWVTRVGPSVREGAHLGTSQLGLQKTSIVLKPGITGCGDKHDES